MRFLQPPLSLSGLQELSIIHYSPVIFFRNGNTAPSLNLSFKSVIFHRGSLVQKQNILLGVNFHQTLLSQSSSSLYVHIDTHLWCPPQFLNTPTPLPLHSYHTMALPFFFLSFAPLAVSLTERDYVEVLMWASLLQISPICQHTAISIPDSDKC